jgi:polyhydroxybutyrate depolymerase
MTRRDVAGSPVAAGDGSGTARSDPKVPSAEIYGGTRPAEAAAGFVVPGAIPTADGRSRTYRLYVPRSLADGAAAPLLVALHGGGGTGEQFQRTAGFDGLAEANRFLVAYPDGVGTGLGEARLRTWNAGTCCGAAAQQKVDDVGFIRALIASVTATRAVDPRRIYAIGHSNGGMLAYRLACELGDRVAAVGVQSSALLIDNCQPSSPVSLAHIHGTGDDNVPIDGGRGARGVAGVDFPPARPSAAEVAMADTCAPDPSTATDSGNPDLVVSTWTGCPPGVGVELIAVAGASHAWMGHDRGPIVEGLVGDPYPDLDSSRALWAFVAAHGRT